jgi:hypothetical protein
MGDDDLSDDENGDGQAASSGGKEDAEDEGEGDRVESDDGEPRVFSVDKFNSQLPVKPTCQQVMEALHEHREAVDDMNSMRLDVMQSELMPESAIELLSPTLSSNHPFNFGTPSSSSSSSSTLMSQSLPPSSALADSQSNPLSSASSLHPPLSSSSSPPIDRFSKLTQELAASSPEQLMKTLGISGSPADWKSNFQKFAKAALQLSSASVKQFALRDSLSALEYVFPNSTLTDHAVFTFLDRCSDDANRIRTKSGKCPIAVLDGTLTNHLPLADDSLPFPNAAETSQ